jgi:hypothetical protein
MPIVNEAACRRLDLALPAQAKSDKSQGFGGQSPLIPI